MSHSPVAERIRRHLIGLRMPRALEALQTVQSQIGQGQLTALEAIEVLLGEEYSTRESRRIKMALQTARLAVTKTLAGYDFSFQPSLERSRVMALAELGFIERRQCVHFLGPPGTGKSHLAVALGVEAVRAGKSVFFATLAELVDSMRKAEREGKLRERVKFLSRYSLLIVDEIGYCEFSAHRSHFVSGVMAPPANTEVWRWLRDVADVRIHGTTKLQPGAQLVAERPLLQSLPPPYPALIKAAVPASGKELRERFHDWRAPLQHPLSVYDQAMGVAA